MARKARCWLQFLPMAPSASRKERAVHTIEQERLISEYYYANHTATRSRRIVTIRYVFPTSLDANHEKKRASKSGLLLQGHKWRSNLGEAISTCFASFHSIMWHTSKK